MNITENLVGEPIPFDINMRGINNYFFSNSYLGSTFDKYKEILDIPGDSPDIPLLGFMILKGDIAQDEASSLSLPYSLLTDLAKINNETVTVSQDEWDRVASFEAEHREVFTSLAFLDRVIFYDHTGNLSNQKENIGQIVRAVLESSQSHELGFDSLGNALSLVSMDKNDPMKKKLYEFAAQKLRDSRFITPGIEDEDITADYLETQVAEGLQLYVTDLLRMANEQQSIYAPELEQYQREQILCQLRLSNTISQMKELLPDGYRFTKSSMSLAFFLKYTVDIVKKKLHEWDTHKQNLKDNDPSIDYETEPMLMELCFQDIVRFFPADLPDSYEKNDVINVVRSIYEGDMSLAELAGIYADISSELNEKVKSHPYMGYIRSLESMKDCLNFLAEVNTPTT